VSGLLVGTPSGAEIEREVASEEYARLLGLPRHRPLEGEIARRAGAARRWYADHGRPRAAARRFAVAGLDGEAVTLEGAAPLRGRALAERLSRGRAHALFTLAVTAGPEVDEESRRLWQAGCPDEAYFLDRFAAAAVERLVIWAMTWVCRLASAEGETVLPHLSPGCGDWELCEQVRVMALITGGDGSALAPLTMLSSGMLAPKSSLLAVFGVARDEVTATPADACRSCDLAPCAFRRAPYRGAA
jgi:hypothetical protein